MSADIIDGKEFSAKIREQVAGNVSTLVKTHGVTPGLAVVIVGEDPASQVYVRNKVRQTAEVGMKGFHFELPEDTSQADLIAKIEDLNADPNVNGILVQLPLPKHLAETAVVAKIAPEKDVDGLHVVNAGLLAGGGGGLVPCTPLGCLLMLKDRFENLSGKRALVIGRSILVGKPVAQLLLNENCTVTIAHSRTKDLAEEVGRADIVVAAVGIPEMVKGAWIKEDATVIDVGINRIDAPERGEGKTRLVGDVEFSAASARADAITPVPGGVGPMTIACLLKNTVTATCRQNDIDETSL